MLFSKIDKNRKQKSIFLSSVLNLFLIWNLFSFITPLSAQTGMEKIEIDEYPNIKIHFREQKNRPVQNEPIQITETYESLTKEMERVNIIRSSKLRPIHIVLAIQASTWEKNKISQSYAETILQSLSNDDKFGLHIYAKETIFLDLNMSRENLLDKISTLNIGENNHVYTNLSFLASQIEKSEIPYYIIVISPESPTDQFDPNSSLNKKINQDHLKINIIGRQERANYYLASITKGKFYTFDESLVLTNVQNDLFNFRKIPPVLEYETEFDNFWDLFPSKKVRVDLVVGNNKFTSDYEINILSFIKSKLSNVEFFFTVCFVLLCICLLIIYGLQKRKQSLIRKEFLKKQAEIKRSDLYFHENNNFTAEEKKPAVISTRVVETEKEEELELDLGDDMDDYPSSEESSYDSEFSDYTPEEEVKDEEIAQTDLQRGESYQSAFLIQKEGPNPGRQFTIHKNEILIGSTPENDLVLWDSTISPKHAKIKNVNNTFYIYDMVSDRGIYINGKKLLKPRPLYDFDEIRLGKTLLLFRGK